MKFSVKRRRQSNGELSFHLKKSCQTSGERYGPIMLYTCISGPPIGDTYHLISHTYKTKA